MNTLYIQYLYKEIYSSLLHVCNASSYSFFRERILSCFKNTADYVHDYEADNSLNIVTQICTVLKLIDCFGWRFYWIIVYCKTNQWKNRVLIILANQRNGKKHDIRVCNTTYDNQCKDITSNQCSRLDLEFTLVILIRKA